ncbi:MAG: S41 family peptidase [Candidatus Melainabacteria bacterium]|nr:S41 family peptidase [Candidatus Melainabacteria bacterium]
MSKKTKKLKTITKLNIATTIIIIFLFGFNIVQFDNVRAVFATPTATSESVIVDRETDIEPDVLYEKVWELIKKDYVDQNFNGQDWNIWQDRYKGKLLTLDDAHKAIETMLTSLGDRYTRFLSKKDFEDEKQAINAKLSGIGIQIGLDKSQRLIVIAPIESTPAHKAGLRAGDEITEINGNPTKGISVEEAATQIKGPIGTKVTLTLLRGKENITKIIERAEIPIRAISKGDAKIIKRDIGYIRLNSFISHDASNEMREAVSKLEDAKGLIIDLRNNPGGLLTNAIEISDMFLDNGLIVSTVDRDGYIQSVKANKDSITNIPVVVLVNENSASASEIFSGALKDNQRAVVVGSTTFGKGLVQGINKLDDGSGVNITIAKYLTPAKIDINELGVKPDIEVKLTTDDYKDSKGPWFSDPNNLPSKRKPDDGKDAQLTKGIEILKDMIKVVGRGVKNDTASLF